MADRTGSGRRPATARKPSTTRRAGDLGAARRVGQPVVEASGRAARLSTALNEMRLLPPSSSGLGHHPFKVAARVRIPLGVQHISPGPVVKSGVHAGLSSRRSRVQVPSGPLGGRRKAAFATERLVTPASRHGRVAQLAEHAPEKRGVTGSTPVSTTSRQTPVLTVAGAVVLVPWTSTTRRDPTHVTGRILWQPQRHQDVVSTAAELGSTVRGRNRDGIGRLDCRRVSTAQSSTAAEWNGWSTPVARRALDGRPSQPAGSVERRVGHPDTDPDAAAGIQLADTVEPVVDVVAAA